VPPNTLPADAVRLSRRLQARGVLLFETAWRVGSGQEGETMSDLGVVLDPAGVPVLPGSSLKGKLRNTCEALAHALNLSACLLNRQLSGQDCVGDVKYHAEVRDQHQDAIRQGPAGQLGWIEKNTCDVCKLFGSPVRASKVRCSDGLLLNPEAAVVQVRDGVVLDRDSHTAVNGLKYDYEVVAAGTRFQVRFDLDNPTEADEALLGAAPFEWHSGGSLGGFTSRGLGRFRLEAVTLSGVDLSDPKQRVRYLTNTDPEKRLAPLGDWEAYFGPRIERQCQAAGGEG
jgi:CRISPR-associated RAMP protein (TIGR02581 family)